MLPDGRVAVAAQHQGPSVERLALLALADADGLTMIDVPGTVSRRF